MSRDGRLFFIFYFFGNKLYKKAQPPKIDCKKFFRAL